MKPTTKFRLTPVPVVITMAALMVLFIATPALGQDAHILASADLELEQEPYELEAPVTATIHYGMPEVVKRMPGLVYPVKAEEFQIEGRVLVAFSVDNKGRVQDPQVLMTPGMGCDQEVLRALNHARFAPELPTSDAPSVRYIAAFDFQLDDN